MRFHQQLGEYEQTLIEYATMAYQFSYNNPEVTSIIIAGIVSYLYRYKYEGNWPLFRVARRFLLPLADMTIGKRYPIEFTREFSKKELAGVYDITPRELRKKFKDHPQIYPNNFAKLKYEYDSGQRKVYEDSSWAYRSKGITSLMQTHLMPVYDQEEGKVRLFAHYEYNPLARPIRHYFGGGVFSISTGVTKARSLMEEMEIN